MLIYQPIRNFIQCCRKTGSRSIKQVLGEKEENAGYVSLLLKFSKYAIAYYTPIKKYPENPMRLKIRASTSKPHLL